ncbi:Nucleotide-binding universal stress protein, UspA family [Flavobacteriaceae bacterium MAR_2010_188]|nr:Nucleotide-binding universal stress protein, UspA family [Flavobacteriaceae bacterium MAR_2010_188]
MKKILVPTDFSKESEYALKVAAHLAKQFDSEIFLLHVLNLPLTTVDTMNTPSALPEAMFFMQLAHKKFKKMIRQPYLNGIKVHEKVKRHRIFDGINEACEENECDIIIMGSHGATGFKEMFVGSNAEKVVRTAKIPVMVIKRHHEEFNVNDFVFASDFKKDNIETYKKAVGLAKLLNSKMHLLIVDLPGKFDNHEQAKQRIKDFILGHEYDNYSINVIAANTVEKGILNFSREIDADLIGISTHGRQGISHFFNGSISEDIANHAKRPVVTFRIPDEVGVRS